MVHGDDG
jgi:hypothetical protein